MQLTINICFCQTADTILLDIDDPIVLNFTIIKKVGEGKCTCEFNNKKCELYLIVIDSVLYIADSVQIPSVANKITFLSMKGTKFNIGSNYSATFMVSHYDYLLYNKIIEYPIFIIPSPIGFVSKVGPCYKFTFKQKLLYKLNINRDKMRKSGKLISKDENNFYQFQKLQLESN